MLPRSKYVGELPSCADAITPILSGGTRTSSAMNLGMIDKESANLPQKEYAASAVGARNRADVYARPVDPQVG
jgi:hypothetical protein